MRLSEAIKHLAVGAVDAESPRTAPTEVVSVSPVEIKLKENSKLIIPEDAIIIPKRMQSGGDDALEPGDRLMTAALTGGQSFFILDKV
nr:phage portal protein [Bacillus subtilis]